MYNDGVFNERDFESISRIGDSKKREQVRGECAATMQLQHCEPLCQTLCQTLCEASASEQSQAMAHSCVVRHPVYQLVLEMLKQRSSRHAYLCTAAVEVGSFPCTTVA